MSWIIPISGLLNLFLGLAVLVQSPKKNLNIKFFIFTIATSVSIGFDYIFRLFPTTFVLKLSYAFATLVPITALFWVLIICGIKYSEINLQYRRYLLLVSVIFFLIPFADSLMIKSIDHLTVLGYKGNLGPLFIIYSLYYVFYILAFVGLLIKVRMKMSGVHRIQVTLILVGISLYGLSALIFSLILPQFFSIFSFTLLDAPSLILFVTFTAYSILRLHFLNIKVITSEALIFIISAGLFIRMITSEMFTDKIVSGFLFILSIVLGSMLIYSIIKEISQRNKIKALADKLELANFHLTYLDRQKSEFISFATHQLRAPLTAMKGYASLILDGDMGKIDDKARVGIQRIYESSNTLAEIVDDYLNITRIELGTMQYHFDTINLKILVKEVVDELRPNFEKTKTKLILEIDEAPDYRMLVDKIKLKQVFENLIDNAFKYTPSGHVKVSLYKDTKKSVIIFKVSDTGIGVSEENISKLFEKFSRARNADQTNKKGTGLGLFVAKEIVKAHKGEIYASSAGEGKGSEFTVELDPLNKI